MTDIERQPQWRSDVRNVQIESRDKLWAWNETRGDGAVVHVEERVKDPGKRYEIERMTEELGGVKAVIATGGLAPVVIDECRTVTHHEPMITLIGLRMVFEKNL